MNVVVGGEWSVETGMWWLIKGYIFRYRVGGGGYEILGYLQSGVWWRSFLIANFGDGVKSGIDWVVIDRCDESDY